jgi:hypothetical protein
MEDNTLVQSSFSATIDVPKVEIDRRKHATTHV